MNSKKAITLLLIATMIMGMIPVSFVNAIDVDALADDDGQYEDTIEVTGDDVTSGYDVKIYWDSVKAWNGEEGLLNTTEAENDGDWLVEFDVPEAVAGNHYLWVEDVKTGETAVSGAFEVLSLIDLSSSSGLAEDDVVVNGYGLAGDVEVAIIMVDDATAPTLTTETDEPGASGDGAATEFEFTLDNALIYPTSVTIDDGVETFTDAAGDGVLTGDAGGEGTINYVTGDVEIEFNAAPADLVDNIECDYDWFEEVVDTIYVLEDEDQTDDLGSFDNTVEIPADTVMDAADYDILILDAEGNMDDAAFEIGPVITLDVEEGPSGLVVEIDGRGFTADDWINVDGVVIQDDDAAYAAVECTILDLDEDVQGNVGTDGIETDDDGEFTLEFVVPWTWTDDDHVITVTDDTGATATADFEVTGLPGIELSVAYGTQGAKITVTGENFTQISGESVDFELWDDEFDAGLTDAGDYVEDIGSDIETDSDGEFSGQLTIPAVDDGTYQVVARMPDYEMYGNTTFRVTLMVVVLSEESGVSGEEIIMTGSGFSDAGDIQANITDEVLFELSLGVGDTSFSDTFFVPTLEAGMYTIVVRDQDADIDVEVEFEVTESTYMEIDPMVAPNEYWIEIVGENYADDSLGDDLAFVLWNATEDWDIDVLDDDVDGSPAVELDDSGNFTGYWKVWDSDDLSLGTYWINATDDEGLWATISFEIVDETQAIAPKKSVFNIGDVVAFDFALSFQEDDSYIEIEDPSGNIYWVTVDFDDEWVSVDETKVVPYYTQLSTNGQLMELGTDAPLGEYSWVWYDAGDDEIDSGVFMVEAAAADLVGGQVEDLANQIDELAADLSGVTDDFDDVKSDISGVLAVAEQAVAAAEAATEAVNAVATQANNAGAAAEAAQVAAENAAEAASGLTTLVYGAIGAALVAALAAIVSLMQISRRIAG